MKISKTLLPLIALSTIFAASESFAQTSGGSSNTGNQSGDAPTAPSGVHLDVNGTNLSVWMINRLHTINLEQAILNMNQSGITQKNYVAGFSAEGALVYQYEINLDELKDWNDIGRNAGGQVIPYSLKILPDGRREIKISAFAFKNMNALQNTKHFLGEDNSHYDGYGHYLFFKTVDQLEFISFSWDQNMTFNNIRTFDFDVVNTNLRTAIATSENKKSYIALRAGGNFGGQLLNLEGSNDYVYENKLRWKGQFHTGIEANIQTKNNMRINLQSNYIKGGADVRFINNGAVRYNTAGENSFNASMAQYNTELSAYNVSLDTWKVNKQMYEQSQLGGNIISDESYAVLSGNQKPVAPNKPAAFEKASENQKMNRTFARVNTSAEVSFPLKKKGQPMRLGFGLNYNLLITDQITSKNENTYGSESKIDLKPHFNQIVTGKIFLNF